MNLKRLDMNFAVILVFFAILGCQKTKNMEDRSVVEHEKATGDQVFSIYDGNRANFFDGVDALRGFGEVGAEINIAGGEGCTSTEVKDRLLLTAAHCVDFYLDHLFASQHFDPYALVRGDKIRPWITGMRRRANPRSPFAAKVSNDEEDLFAKTNGRSSDSAKASDLGLVWLRPYSCLIDPQAQIKQKTSDLICDYYDENARPVTWVPRNMNFQEQVADSLIGIEGYGRNQLANISGLKLIGAMIIKNFNGLEEHPDSNKFSYGYYDFRLNPNRFQLPDSGDSGGPGFTLTGENTTDIFSVSSSTYNFGGDLNQAANNKVAVSAFTALHPELNKQFVYLGQLPEKKIFGDAAKFGRPKPTVNVVVGAETYMDNGFRNHPYEALQGDFTYGTVTITNHDPMYDIVEAIKPANLRIAYDDETQVCEARPGSNMTHCFLNNPGIEVTIDVKFAPGYKLKKIIDYDTGPEGKPRVHCPCKGLPCKFTNEEVTWFMEYEGVTCGFVAGLIDGGVDGGSDDDPKVGGGNPLP